MEAEFFCLNEHLEAAGSLVRHLTRHVDPTIALKVVNVDRGDPDDGRARLEAGRRYARLLHASVPPERELRIEANTEIELFGFRIYLRLYWPMLVQGYYLSSYGDWVHGTYRVEYYRQFHGGGRGLERFVPALAFRDRMVLVPRGQNETLAEMGTNEKALPLLERGVIEVDFADRDDVERAFVEIGKGLRRELRHELLAYQGFHPTQEGDLDTVAAHLAVPPALLRHAIREETDAKELIFRQLRCELEPDALIRDVQTRVALWVENPSDVDLGRLRVQVRGPASGLEVHPERAEIRLGPGARIRTDFSLAATRVGDFAVEVMFLDADVDVPRDMLPTRQLWLTARADGR